MSVAHDRVVAALEAHGSRGRGRDWICPSHDDRNPSLSVTPASDRVLVRCHGGCEIDDVLAAIGLTRRDLFDAPERALRTVAATYPYVDEGGELLFEVVRLMPKTFRQRRPDGRGGWVWNLNGTRRVLYHLPEVIRAVAEGWLVYVVEGEKDVASIAEAGAVATCNAGGAGKWRQDYSETLRGADVVVVADRDEAGRAHVLQVAASLEGVAASVAVVEPAEGKDVTDHLRAGHTLDDLIAASEVESLSRDKDGPKSVVVADSPRVNRPLGEVLADVEATLRRYVIMGGNARTIVATWIAHVFAFRAAEFTAYLAVTSATKRSGKSRLLEVLEVILGPTRSVSTSNISAASLFRLIDAHPGLAVLVDEVDRIPKEKAEEMWGLINSGWRVTGKAHRQTGAKMTELATFSTFSPKVLAGIGTLPDTVADRAITIRMERRLQTETVERLRLRRAADEVAGLRADLERWGDDEATITRLSEATPTFPAGMTNDRLMDVAEPLFAIADMAGGDWPARVRTAVLALDADAEKVAEEELGTLALRHVHEAFLERGVDRMFTDEILGDLVRREDGPWAEWWGDKVDAGKPVGPARRLGMLLERFDDVKPKTMRIGSDQRKGYHLEPITVAAARYIAVPTVPPVSPLASNDTDGTGGTVPQGVGGDAADPEPGWIALQRDAGEQPETDEGRALELVKEMLGAVEIHPTVAPAGELPRGVPEARHAIRMERHRGLDDRNVAALFNSAPDRWPAPPAGCQRWSAHVVRLVLGEASA